MSFDADLNACAALVERADPLRFRAAMAAPVAARRVLFPLYAFNVEVARAPWVTQEPMIAEMRLQWWRDVSEEIAEGRAVRRHEVATPLAQAITPQDAALLDELAAARRWDIYKDAFEDEAHFARYMDQTAGNLTWVAARSLGPADETTVRDAASSGPSPRSNTPSCISTTPPTITTTEAIPPIARGLSPPLPDVCAILFLPCARCFPSLG